MPTLFEFMRIVSREDQAIDYLRQNNVFYEENPCDCEQGMALHGKVFRCTKKACRKQVSLLKGSFFANGKLKVNEVLLIGYLWLNNCTHTTIHQMTGHSKNTISDYLRHYRQLVASSLEDDVDVIGGPGIIVQVDESKFGKRKNNRGHPVVGAWVIGGVEDTANRKFFCEVVEKRDAITILQVLSKHILPGSIVHTDCWRAYLGISDTLQVTHRTVNHSKHFLDPDTGVHTNTIEALWSWLKSAISLRGRVKELLPDQLLEQIWRRKNADHLMCSLLQALKEVGY